MTDAAPATRPQILESSLRIAWDYLEATGELGEPEHAAHFLLETIELLMRTGERRRLLLSNKAIDAYRHWRAGKSLARAS